MVVAVDQDEAARLGEPDAEEEAGIRLLIDQLRPSRPACRGDAGRAWTDGGSRSSLHVEHPPAVARPHDAAARALDAVVEFESGLDFADADGVELGAALVEAPGEIAVIAANDAPPPNRKYSRPRASALPSIMTVSGPPSRAVRASTGCWPPATYFVSRRMVHPVPAPMIDLLDAALHLGEQRLLQRRRVGHDRPG